MADEDSVHIKWDDELAPLSIVEEEEDLETASHRSGNTSASHHTRNSVDLKSIEALLNEGREWSKRSKLSFSFIVTLAMILSTVRIKSEVSSRLISVETVGQKMDYFGKGNESETEETIDIFNLTSKTENLIYLAEVTDFPVKKTDVPFLFHVPRSGGNTVRDILGSCYKMTEASIMGKRKHHTDHDSLQIVHSEDGLSYVDVDTSTVEGIYRAKKLGLVEHGLANVIISQHIHPAAEMFNLEQQGRCFSIIRHPIERAVSMFHYLGVASTDPNYDPSLAYMSIEMYARSKRAEYNWMVRLLANELENDLTKEHLELAKEVLQRKCLVGLLEEKEESFRRFEKYFGWESKTKEEEECRERLLNWGWSNKHSHPSVEEGSVVWDLLYKKNELDMELYDYAKDIFLEQVSLFKSETNGEEEA
mmetsp:Transcript_4351/g.4808  ORF Transcript_4351/g.4808 Transcript_4351/m.4808 type:complete len:420 (+) Transcript_4351:8-1267(+)|eukprot:CAMPEP_0194149884 /NCGR_PEP_ID=MMETSP0152-20130528/40392_1 /TAXON_ID=1049557 /ORGANISM="Thalassiothrix antarctica, Strain L6-D1" /LENGTH=419 /DNA_ID=CAMNT_0038852395 /DNA_START=126 /DNA_END=1385 /DNA_ORIENTATION=-